MNRIWHLVYLVVIAALLFMLVRPQPADYLGFQAALLDKTGNWGSMKWHNHPIWQSVTDVWTLQETIFEVKPDLIIECGTYKGGSAYFFGDLFNLIGKGHVITVDIAKQHDLTHPRVTFLIGDCASPEIVKQIRAERDKVTGPVMVVLDSDHRAEHVRKELDAYHSFVTPGSFLHVQDGVIDVLPQLANARPGPLAAIETFLPQHPEFEVDTERTNRFLITQHPKGWLRRKAN
jgi:cephalosporin hydroxylase